jgi:hypothetical protein
MAVHSELGFSPEVKPHRINAKHNPPNVGREFTTLFAEQAFEPSFAPLLGVFERAAQGGVSIAPIDVDPRLLGRSEFLLASVQDTDANRQGGTFQAARMILRIGETNSYSVEGSLPTRRAREAGTEPDPLRPTLEISLVDVNVSADGTVTYAPHETPTVDIYRQYHPERHLGEYLYTISTTDQSGTATATIDSIASEQSAETARHAMWLISSTDHVLNRTRRNWLIR